MNWKTLIDAESSREHESRLRGSKLTVRKALMLIADGVPLEDIKAEFPGVTEEHLRAAQAYAAEQLEESGRPSLESVDRQLFELTTKANTAKWAVGVGAALIFATLGITEWKTIPDKVSQEVTKKISSDVIRELQKTQNTAEASSKAAQQAKNDSEQSARQSQKALEDAIINSNEIQKIGASLTRNRARVGITWMGMTRNGRWPNNLGWSEWVPFDPPFDRQPEVIAGVAFVSGHEKRLLSAYAAEIYRSGCLIIFQCDSGAPLCLNKLPPSISPLPKIWGRQPAHSQAFCRPPGQTRIDDVNGPRFAIMSQSIRSETVKRMKNEKIVAYESAAQIGKGSPR